MIQNNPYMSQQPYFTPLQAPYSQQNSASVYQSVSLSGRSVNDFSEISANDVPMNGSCAYFPKNDLSEIQIRRWTPQGTIEAQTYIKADNVPKQPTEMELLTERVAKLEEALNKPVAKRGKNNEPTDTSE